MDVEITELFKGALPPRMSPDAAGLDLVAAIESSLVIAPSQQILVSAGVRVAIPKGYAGFVLSRSGLATHHQVVVANAPGLIDSDYRGEVHVLLRNQGNEEYTVRPLDRIAQMVLLRCEGVRWLLVDILDDTSRGAGGFGHTGR